MIIQALHQRYLELAADPKSNVSPLYFSSAKYTYVLTIDRQGRLVDMADMRENTDKKRPLLAIVPEQPTRSSGVSPYFLCDKAEYILGYAQAAADGKTAAKKTADALKKFQASRELAYAVLGSCEHAMAQALLRFYDNWNPEEARQHKAVQPYVQDLDKGIDTNMVFYYDDEDELEEGQSPLFHKNATLQQAWMDYRKLGDDSEEYIAQCLLTGEVAPIARTHDKIKGVRNAQSSGASLVSFNFRSADSYGKDSMQSYNAPVSKQAMFGYTTALNHLLASPDHSTVLGDMTIVFWAAASPVGLEMEAIAGDMLNRKASRSEITQLRKQVHDVLERARRGQKLDKTMIPQGDTPFYMLGLAPNMARVSVRFFWQGEFGDLVVKLGQHEADMAMIGLEDADGEMPSVNRILRETMRVGSEGKKVGDEPPPALGGELLRAVILGTAYPFALFNMIINRVRADRIVNPLRAAILKAYLNRYRRIGQAGAYLKEELTVALQETKEPAYRLGRLFAVLEKLQQEAAGGAGRLNSTIKDRYFGAASANPAAVFPVLIKLAQHHVSKAKFGEFRDRELAEIMHGMDVTEFPKRLDLQRQGMFIVGYYQQKQHIYEQIKIASDAKKDQAGATSSTDDGQAE
ncbi:type I-C CRISPR-associated protein Cas8c/Csd1 [Paenibacillus athensensis]|uniref:Type I-C CRISPR-associated protein Cas8c/Csd1 n=1 Tax=Paenibacillus athensensis TaxID=1967502 RepID=A0A4Y8PXB9_9BACL|nr:type I-C CRISPR-associated protein Cas8c/Csd1 [Paenibacillus athensensis]MCD1258066.1 type I-C CRISPR-associated protein Cas8c/Csd1 [Paenibacillus athensensis]